MKAFKVLIVFLIINFGALAIGGWLMNNGPQTDWYLILNKAPWTPPGWVFGAAWTTIMICFSIYMTSLYLSYNTIKLRTLFGIQVLLNVSWNYVFFNKHLTLPGLLIILLLTVLIFYLLLTNQKKLKLKSLLILPYFIWLCIASSLNFYIVLYN
jgi:tryptophan-rich sensory protein